MNEKFSGSTIKQTKVSTIEMIKMLTLIRSWIEKVLSINISITLSAFKPIINGTIETHLIKVITNC